MSSSILLRIRRYLLVETESSSPPPPDLAWDEAWDVKTAKLAYEHARETSRGLDETANALDRKAIAIFAIAAVISTVGPSLLLHDPHSATGVLAIAACVACGLSLWFSWRGFKPRRYISDPSPRSLLSAEWLELDPGRFYVARLRRVMATVESNAVTLADRGTALESAFGWALVEVVILLAAVALQHV